MRPIGLLLLLGLALVPRAACAQAADGSSALALAALVGENSPLVGPPAKKLLAKFLDGETKVDYYRPDNLRQCRQARLQGEQCRYHVPLLRARVRHTHGDARRAARIEFYATLIEIGVSPDVGAGSVFEAVSKLDCKIDPNAVIENAGGGAHCDYAAPQ